MMCQPVARLFLSTLSLRRATGTFINCNSNFTHFYPRSPCGERPLTDDVSTGGKIISIHALLAESDAIYPCVTPPKSISIHALLAESDSISGIINNVINYFYPRSPCGERLKIRFLFRLPKKFLSTLSLRRAT